MYGTSHITFIFLLHLSLFHIPRNDKEVLIWEKYSIYALIEVFVNYFIKFFIISYFLIFVVRPRIFFKITVFSLTCNSTFVLQHPALKSSIYVKIFISVFFLCIDSPTCKYKCVLSREYKS